MGTTDEELEDESRERPRQKRRLSRAWGVVTAAALGLLLFLLGRVSRRETMDEKIHIDLDARKHNQGVDLPELREAIEEGYETSDLSARGGIMFGLGLLVVMAVILGAITLMQTLLQGSPPVVQPPSAGVSEAIDEEVPDEQELRAASGVELGELREAEEQFLTTYGWVNEDAGVVHIPIERAMDLVAERGLPTRGDAEPLEAWGPDLPSDSSSGQRFEEVAP